MYSPLGCECIGPTHRHCVRQRSSEHRSSIQVRTVDLQYLKLKTIIGVALAIGLFSFIMLVRDRSLFLLPPRRSSRGFHPDSWSTWMVWLELYLSAAYEFERRAGLA